MNTSVGYEKVSGRAVTALLVETASSLERSARALAPGGRRAALVKGGERHG